MSLTGIDSCLNVQILDGRLVISIGINNLANAFHESENNNPMDEDEGDFVRLYQVTDVRDFAMDVLTCLDDESEDGSTMITRMLDSACWDAVMNGSDGVIEEGNYND